jgi:hypothetical protein
MNLGFYVDKTDGSERNVEIFNALNAAVDNKEVDDACVFFNNVDHNPVHTRFGMFNGTDIWHFTGNLIATSISNVHKALKSVNKFKLSYLYDPAEKNLIGLLELVGRVNIIARNEEEGKEFYRLTGEKPKVLSSFSVKNIKQVLP